MDARGQISRVQRYYDDLTWSYAVGVLASLVPVWSLRTMRNKRFTSLLSLRSALSAAGVPCRDVPLSGRAFDLSHEREFLMLTESIVRGLDPESAAASKVRSGGQIDESARIVGSVVVQRGARIESNATVIGPAVIGAGATVSSGALVVQCVVNKEVRIPQGSVVRHRLVSDAMDEPPAVQGPPAYDPLAVRGFRSEMRDERPTSRTYTGVKRIVESAMATLALIVLSPLMALVAVLIKLESKGPVFFVDRREARGQKTFGCFKFRTMRTGADLLQRQLRQQNDVDGPQFKLEKDPRLTRIGRWIRPCSIDELPQLINVMLGQMSLIGPRPSPFRENQTCVPWRDGRLSVRPGITGLWQVCRHNRGDGDFHQWIHYDLLYVQHMSPLVDLKIALATIVTLGGKWCVPLNWIIPAKDRLEE